MTGFLRKLGRTIPAAAALMLPAALAATAPASAASAAGRAPAAAPAPARAAAAGDQGSTGWQTYRDLNQALPDLTQGTQTRAFSSFDRTGGNADFGHCQQTTASGGCVLAQHSGPGEIDAIWTTSNGGDVTQTGNIHVMLDGKTVLDAPEQSVVNGNVGAPFVYPLVANAQESSGGDYIMVPMSFRQSMEVWTDHDPDYYHVWYRSFADANGVTTFNPADPASDVIAKLKASGTQDPKAPQPGATTQTSDLNLAPGASATLATLHGPGEISALKLQLPQLAAPPTPTYISDDGRAFGTDTSAYDQFTVKINPDNQGVQLTRRLDAGVASQVADVYVDGTKVAQWAPLPGQSGCNWANETVDLPASATAGKSQITIKDQFVSSSNDFNTFNYWADSIVNGQPVQTDQVDVGPSHTADESAHNYTINEQTFSGTRNYCYPPSSTDQQKVLASNDVLQNVRLRISFDGQQMVDAPLGQFFGSGLGLYSVKTLMYAMDPSTKTMSAWWPMPYMDKATVTLYNGSHQAITAGQAQVTSDLSAQWAQALSPAGHAGYFHATSNDQQTTPGKDYLFLKTAGWGKFAGVSETMRGPTTRGYLEGDFHAFVDGSRTPQINGTGTEDFYQGGWYFDNGPFTNPFNGETANESQDYGCQQDCTSAYRSTLTDAIPFHSQIQVGIEHGGVDDVQAEYASTAYWYGRSQEAQTTTDTLSVGDPASEAAHQYASSDPGSVTTLTDTFEGDDGPYNGLPPMKETHTLRDTGSPVSFQMHVDPSNQGVTLRRLSDQDNGYQSAEVYVDGQDAGTWLQPLASPYHRWLDDFFQIPPGLTANRDSITVRLVPTAGSPPWSAAEYQARSSVGPSTDRQPPAQVTGVKAVTGQKDLYGVGPTNTITLSWPDATDNVSVDHYNIYASATAGFQPGPASLAGTTDTNTFTQTGLGLGQTRYYRVEAVDEADNTGQPSAPVSATTPASYQTGTAEVCTSLGNTNDSYGLVQVDGADGRTVPVTVAGLSGRSTTTEDNPSYGRYMYFNVGDNVVFDANGVQAAVTVRYYDHGTGTFTLQYDSTDSSAPVDGAYANGATITKTNTDTWKTATFTVTNARFGNRENNGADFRLAANGNTDASNLVLHVVSVEVTGVGVPSESFCPSTVS